MDYVQDVRATPIHHERVVELPKTKQFDTLNYTIDANQLHNISDDQPRWVTIPVPNRFANGEIINNVLYISDVDGVMRTLADRPLDQDVVSLAKELLKTEKVFGTFISGTPVFSDLNVEECRRGNTSLKPIFEEHFAEDIKAERVRILGAMGGQQLAPNGEVEIIEHFTLDQSFQIAKLLLEVFLERVVETGTPPQAAIAGSLMHALHNIQLINPHQDISRTPDEFVELLESIRSQLDPELRLLCNGADVELQVSRGIDGEAITMQKNLTFLLHLKLLDKENSLSSLEPHQRIPASGPAKRGSVDFNFVKISKLDKGQAIAGLVSGYMQKNPNAFVIVFGDSSVDLPMMHSSDLGIFVGGMKSISNLTKPSQMVMVTDENGNDFTNVAGTVTILRALLPAIGQSFYDLKYVPMPDAQGKISNMSIADILLLAGCSTLEEVQARYKG
ncbi:MAG: hypothetical protein Q8K75_09550 [Chlamydiales bacterium]|nr:hypothetical protein [Chlamydiales bacterium]